MDESSFLNPAKVARMAHLAEGMHVADFESGSGFFARAAARAVGPQGLVWAVDANREMLKHLQTLAQAEGLSAMRFVAGNIEHRGGSGLPDEAVDIVIAANILFSAQDKNTLVEEMWRVLKHGGRALVIDWSDSFGGLGPHPTHVVTEKSARALLQGGGFDYMEAVPAGQYHWGFLMRKKKDRA